MLLCQLYQCGVTSAKCKQDFMKQLPEAQELEVYINTIHILLWTAWYASDLFFIFSKS